MLFNHACYKYIIFYQVKIMCVNRLCWRGCDCCWQEETEIAAGLLSLEMSYTLTSLGMYYRKLDKLHVAKDRLDR